MEIINHINDFLWTYLLIAILLGGGLYFTISTRAIQFRAIPEMIRLLCQSAPRDAFFHLMKNASDSDMIKHFIML